MEKQRNPTEFNQDLLRAWFKDYFTKKAAAFDRQFNDGKYQAAAYILDSIQNIWAFGYDNGALGEEEAKWLWGGEDGNGILDHHKEAVCRARADGEAIQDEVTRRFENVIANTRSNIRLHCDAATVNKVIPILMDTVAKYDKAGESMRNPRR